MVIPLFLRRLLFGNKILNTDTMDALKNPNATLIDLRNQDELDEFGSIEQAKHIPLMELPSQLEEVKKFSLPIVLFCKAGGRAEKAKQFLESQGITEVYNAGGYDNVKEILG
ncbi:rhodanese-like domain-containing protein [Ornithobacterium rhinotracheale]